MTCSRSLRGCSLRHCYQKLSSPARSAASYLTHVSDEGLIRRGGGGAGGGETTISPFACQTGSTILQCLKLLWALP